MQQPRWLHQARSTILDLIFPPRCVGCGYGGRWLCAQCVASLKYLNAPLCVRCGQELGDANHCNACRSRPLPAALAGVRAVAHYDGHLRRAIHAFKYERLTALAEPLGAILADYLVGHSLPHTLILPVPLHPERERERGYNQSLLLAAVVGRHSRVPVNHRVLARVRNTRPQVGLNEQERQDNLLGAFRCTGRVDDQQVLLIDDVCTTGATMSQCALALRAAGARSVWGLTLAR
ncbi:MAG: ComF family protein [Chloroflexi bacterium]|nr:ComF family protein [Chloroflexota bacterium]